MSRPRGGYIGFTPAATNSGGVWALRELAIPQVGGVPGGARILYYRNTLYDFRWSSLGNWWSDPAGTVAATSLPGEGDTVVLMASVTVFM